MVALYSEPVCTWSSRDHSPVPRTGPLWRRCWDGWCRTGGGEAEEAGWEGDLVIFSVDCGLVAGNQATILGQELRRNKEAGEID